MDVFIEQLDTLAPMSNAFNHLVYVCMARAKKTRVSLALALLKEAQNRTGVYRAQLVATKAAYDAVQRVVAAKLPGIQKEIEAASSERNWRVAKVAGFSLMACAAIFLGGALWVGAVATSTGAVFLGAGGLCVGVGGAGVHGRTLKDEQGALDQLRDQHKGMSDWSRNFVEALTHVDTIAASVQRLEKAAATEISKTARATDGLEKAAQVEAAIAALAGHLPKIKRENSSLNVALDRAVKPVPSS